MQTRKLGKKQNEDNDYWLSLWANIPQLISKQALDLWVDKTLEEISAVTRGKNVAFGWSGGKDSQALLGLCRMVGINQCVLGMCNLEYPEFLKWVTDQMPWELTIINTGQDLEWLSQNPEMLFPQDSKTAGMWFKSVQHKAQTLYFRDQKLDMILLGRRKQDGNFTGTNGIYTNSIGVTRYSPIRHWSHEMIMAMCHYYNLELPPFYRWPNGWVVGTGAWAARQWTGCIENGWKEVYSIDPSIVREAADYLESARIFIDRRDRMQRQLEALR